MTATTPTRAVNSAARLDPRTDSDLLARFQSHHDQAAFAALVSRHGPLVYGVCRRALGPSADADDAFQATFLVLVKRAGAIPWRANLGPWLFGVAHRIAAKARFHRDRRFALEKQVDTMPHPETASPDRAESDDLSRLFDEELAKLPEEMRRAVVLCELQGLSRSAAAKQLRISEGTLSSRLGRARKKLAAAFASRGVKLAIPVGVSVSVALATQTARAACDPAGAVPTGVSYLVQEALKAMTVSKLKIGAVLAAVAVGCSWMAFADEPKQPIALPGAKTDPPKAENAPDVVATVNGQNLTRDEFADYLIKRYGAKEIEQFTNKRIIEQAAAKAKVSVTDAEVDAAFNADVETLAGGYKPQFADVVLRKHGKTEAEWREDVIRPRLLMERLTQVAGTVSEEYLKNLFERKYGEQRRVYMAFWRKPAVSKEGAREAYERVKKDSLAFYQSAMYTESADRPRDTADRTILFSKATLIGGEKVRDAAFALSKVDEVSELIETTHGWYALKLVEVIKTTDKRFEEVKDELKQAALREKTDAAIPSLFAKLKEDAKPVYHIKPASLSLPQPTKK